MSTLNPIYLRDYQVPAYLIEHVELIFELEENATIVTSTLKIQRNPHYPLKTPPLTLHGENLELLAVAINAQRLPTDAYQLDEKSLTIKRMYDQCSLQIVTRIKPQENTALSGLYKSSNIFCTQCEAEGFRRITYYLDRPDVMAPFTTRIYADEQRYPILLSNGNLVARGKGVDGKHWVEWRDPFKKPSYLFALVAGDLACLEDQFTTMTGRQVKLQIYVEKENFDKTQHAMRALKKAMRWDEEHYQREYDLDVYMLVAVNDFNMGAMENKGLNIFNSQYVLAKPETATDLDYLHIESVIAHEYFHNWTGNRITCRDWFQLSLKEGLTIFRDQSFTADTTSATVARIHDVNYLRNSQFPEDAGPLAHPVQPQTYIEINNFYTATIYNKGSEIIRMMRVLLGDKKFMQAMQLYFTRHDGQAVTIEEFVRCMEDTSHLDLQQFRLWYRQPGTPRLIISDSHEKKTQQYSLKVRQSNPTQVGQVSPQPLHLPLKIGLLDQQGKLLREDVLEIKKIEEVFNFSNLPEKPVPSLLREFSAPVIVEYPYSPSDLLFLLQHDDDLFNRWEAGQRYAVQLILTLANDFRQAKIMHVPKDYTAALQQLIGTTDDKLLLTELLTLPSEKYVAELMPVIDVEAIHEAREFVLKAVAEALKETFTNLYYQYHQSDYAGDWNMAAMGTRSLKNLALAYLMQLETPSAIQLAKQQFDHALAKNMTDTLAALQCLCNSTTPLRASALTEFYQHWAKDDLILDKWFSVQATAKLPNTLAEVKALLAHPAFDIQNPNKVYALIGSFTHRNLRQFHQADGRGYEFLAQCVQQLDALNPQIAARMVKPLCDWRRYDKVRQDLMRSALTRIANTPALSTDVAELVTKSLQNQENTHE